MAKKSKVPQPKTSEFYSICLSDGPRPKSHIKLCANCEQKEAREKAFWIWRMKTRKETPCPQAICRECGWLHAAHKKELAKK